MILSYSLSQAFANAQHATKTKKVPPTYITSSTARSFSHTSSLEQNLSTRHKRFLNHHKCTESVKSNVLFLFALRGELECVTESHAQRVALMTALGA